MMVKEKIIYAGRTVYLTWYDNTHYPAQIPVTQAMAVCFNEQRKILVVRQKDGWILPGGHPEPDETPEQALIREVWEEAAIKVRPKKVIGYLEVDDPENTSIEGKHYIQLRYLVTIEEISKFENKYETIEREFIAIDDLPERVGWMKNSIVGKEQFIKITEIANKNLIHTFPTNRLLTA